MELPALPRRPRAEREPGAGASRAGRAGRAGRAARALELELLCRPAWDRVVTCSGPVNAQPKGLLGHAYEIGGSTEVLAPVPLRHIGQAEAHVGLHTLTDPGLRGQETWLRHAPDAAPPGTRQDMGDPQGTDGGWAASAPKAAWRRRGGTSRWLWFHRMHISASTPTTQPRPSDSPWSLACPPRGSCRTWALDRAGGGLSLGRVWTPPSPWACSPPPSDRLLSEQMFLFGL